MENEAQKAPNFAKSTIDPVLRCDSCQKIAKLDTLHKMGVCPHCGNKRFRSLNVMSEAEAKQISEWGFDDFLKVFEEVEDE